MCQVQFRLFSSSQFVPRPAEGENKQGGSFPSLREHLHTSQCASADQPLQSSATGERTPCGYRLPDLDQQEPPWFIKAWELRLLRLLFA